MIQKFWRSLRKICTLLEDYMFPCLYDFLRRDRIQLNEDRARREGWVNWQILQEKS